METNASIPNSENAIINEAHLILAEKRTRLAMLRTGIAILALPMTLVSFLIATSRLYDIAEVMFYLIPLFILCSVPLGLGGTWTDHEQSSVFRQRQSLFSLAMIKACMVSN